MHYVAKIHPSGKRWRAEFPDIPGCEVVAATEDEAVVAAQRALAALLQVVLTGPGLAPRRRYRGPGLPVAVDVAVGFAIELREARSDACLSRKDLADRASVATEVVDDLELAHGVPALEKVIPVAKALGMRPVIELERPGVAVGLTRGRL